MGRRVFHLFVFFLSILFILSISPLGTNERAGPRREGGEGNPVFLVRLLHASGLEVFQDHLLETLLLALAGLERIDQLVVLVHAQHAVRRQAFHGERPGPRELSSCPRRACRSILSR